MTSDRKSVFHVYSYLKTITIMCSQCSYCGESTGNTILLNSLSVLQQARAAIDPGLLPLVFVIFVTFGIISHIY